MTAGVYGLVAGIVKLDDAGPVSDRRAGQSSSRACSARSGVAILRLAPLLMKVLSIAGTAAMFLVGGGILVHGIPLLHHWSEALTAHVGAALGWLVPLVANALVGVLGGGVAVGVVTLVRRMWPGRPEAGQH